MRLTTFNFFMPEQCCALVLGLVGQEICRDISESLKGLERSREIMERGERKEI